MIASIPELLRSVDLFAGLEPEVLAAIATRTRRRSFPAQEALFHEGDPGETLYVIVKGEVSIQRVGGAGEIIQIARRGPGDPIGELALIDGKPRMADAVTAETCDLLVLDRPSFLAWIEESPRIAAAVMRCLGRRVREAADDLEHHVTRSVLVRVAAALLEFAPAEAPSPSDAAETPRIRISTQALAQRVGATRESVSRSLARLRRMGALAEGRALIVRNRALLRSLTEAPVFAGEPSLRAPHTPVSSSRSFSPSAPLPSGGSVDLSSRLQEIPLFRAMNPADRADLAAQSRCRQFPADEALYHAGDPSHTLYVVLEGWVQLRRIAPTQEIVSLARRGPGEIFGELGLLDSEPRMSDAVTAAPSVLLMVPGSLLVECLERTPRAALAMMARLADQLRAAADALEQRRGRDVLRRVAALLLELSREASPPRPTAAVRITQEHLAVEVGARRESVNRALGRLRNAGAIRLYGGRWLVSDPAKLSRFADEA